MSSQEARRRLGAAHAQLSGMKPIDWHGLFSPEMHPVEVLIRVTRVYLFAQRHAANGPQVRAAYLEPDGKVTFLFRKEEGASLH